MYIIIIKNGLYTFYMDRRENKRDTFAYILYTCMPYRVLKNIAQSLIQYTLPKYSFFVLLVATVSYITTNNKGISIDSL